MEISALNFSKLQERLRKLVTCNGSFMWRLWKQKCKVARECARVTRTREKLNSFCYTIQQHQVKDIGEQALLDFAAHQLLIIRCPWTFSIGISTLQKEQLQWFSPQKLSIFHSFKADFLTFGALLPIYKGGSAHVAHKIISCRNSFHAHLTHNLLDKNTSFRILQQSNR